MSSQIQSHVLLDMHVQLTKYVITWYFIIPPVPTCDQILQME